ncbi:MAG: hypothetical protein KID09_28210 [Paenibacillus macerans]|nr:hypothetical protein [Paenibacillus macerans]
MNDGDIGHFLVIMENNDIKGLYFSQMGGDRRNKDTLCPYFFAGVAQAAWFCRSVSLLNIGRILQRGMRLFRTVLGRSPATRQTSILLLISKDNYDNFVSRLTIFSENLYGIPIS